MVMLPRLKAEEQLNQIEAVAVGTGSAKKSDSQEIISELNKAVRSGQRAKRATRADIASMGIKIEEG